MSINSRAKGRAFEQDVARRLRDELGVEITRNWAEQACHGGTDLIGLDGWAIECKRSKKYSNDWRVQAAEQAAKVECVPVLIFKLDYKPIIAELPASGVVPELENESYWLQLPFAAWIALVRERMCG